MYEPQKQVSSDSEPFLVPGLPGDIKLTRKQLPDMMRLNEEIDFTRMFKASKEVELKSFGRRALHVGLVSLCNGNFEDKDCRGKQATIDENEYLKWLNSKKPDSVVYICFGSVANFNLIS
ncbi:hypothetical protein LWI28_016584 [Acer negundo]|uniref:Uncharacterized protein n=1 Tax=Acer negundo TaxID=4023 RepID=A0AAD5IZR0_ACENE|nr:hypothetical protein LWI28_016584 [Acer negundo]